MPTFYAEGVPTTALQIPNEILLSSEQEIIDPWNRENVTTDPDSVIFLPIPLPLFAVGELLAFLDPLGHPFLDFVWYWWDWFHVLNVGLW